MPRDHYSPKTTIVTPATCRRLLKTRTVALPAAAAPAAPGEWQIVRNQKMHFAVSRKVDGETEFLLSASGRASSFKTWAGARRAKKRANGI